DDAYRLLAPITGSGLAAILFGIALLVSGQSSTFTGTVAGQVILEGFLNLKIPCYQRRLITRALALGPALIGVLWLGEGSVGRLLAEPGDPDGAAAVRDLAADPLHLRPRIGGPVRQ